MGKAGLGTAILIIVLVFTAIGCDTLNVGTGQYNHDCRVLIGNVWITADNWNAGEEATMVVDGIIGTPPHTIAIETGTAMNVPAGTPVDQGWPGRFEWTFILEEGALFNWNVEVITAYGGVATQYGTYGPVGPPLNERPVIEDVNYMFGVLTVTVSDAEGDDVTVAVTDITGLEPDSFTQVVTGGNGDAVFTWIAEDLAVGGSGVTTITAWDDRHFNDPATDTASISFSYTWEPAEGQIVAHAMASRVAVDEEVTIRVVCGDFPAGASFAYMNGVAVTVTDGFSFIPDSLNVGAIGGEQKDVDGIWANMDPAPSTFFIPEDFMMMPNDVATDSSLDFMGFNITPIGAGEVMGGGDLFNFRISFNAPGEYHIGFLEFQDVMRTYYSDANADEYYWLDISNVMDNLTNTVVVE